MRIRFGDLELDEATRQLRRAGAELPLPGKAFELLRLLVGQHPRAVSKAEIRDALWPATFVSESNLSSLVAELRAALGDDAGQPSFIRTVYGFGYAFCGTPLRDAPPAAAGRFRLLIGARSVVLPAGETVLGRGGEAGLPLASGRASRRHARIVVEGESALLEDLGSKNGTLLNGSRIAAACSVHDGDVIEISGERLVVQIVVPGSTETDVAR
jgi:DNA-binding winged helix-turn-helix (wHTH) protein